MNSNKVYVVGVGMTNFVKPGGPQDYPDFAKEAITSALNDAAISYDLIEQACIGYVYGDSTCGQRALYTVGLSGIPIYNVNNNCATGSTAIYMAQQFIKGGADCILALGFEKMEKGSLGSKYDDRTNPLDQHMGVMNDLVGLEMAPPALQLFGNAGAEHMKLYGTTEEHFAKIAAKNHKHSVNNPRSQFRKGFNLEQVKKAPKAFGPLTKLQCCPTSDGAAAAIIVSERFINKHPHLKATAVELAGIAMATDTQSTFNDNSMIKMVGFDMTKNATEKALKMANMSVNDVQAIELHDCFSANELITYEALGLCKLGGAGALIDKGDNTYGGKWVVNPSGGLISKGHPLGATGLAQCFELNQQIRGLCGPRQVPGMKVGLQHNLGLGGAVVVAIYKSSGFNYSAEKPKFELVSSKNAPAAPRQGVAFGTPSTPSKVKSAL